MISFRTITAAVLAACLLATGGAPASANPNDSEVVKYKKAMSDYVKTWGDAAKKLNGDKGKAGRINNEFAASVRSYSFPENMDEDDVKDALAKMRSGLDSAAKAAFGRDASATVREQTKHNLKKGAPRLLDVAVTIN